MARPFRPKGVRELECAVSAKRWTKGRESNFVSILENIISIVENIICVWLGILFPYLRIIQSRVLGMEFYFPEWRGVIRRNDDL